MFSLERGMRYWLYSEPTDMRKSFHTVVEGKDITREKVLAPENARRRWWRLPGVCGF